MSQSCNKDGSASTIFRTALCTNLGPNFMCTVVNDSLRHASVVRWKYTRRGGGKLLHVPRGKNPRRLVSDYHLPRTFPFVGLGLRRLLPEEIAKDPRVFITNKVGKCEVELPGSGFAFGDHLKNAVDCSQDCGREPADSKSGMRKDASVLIP